ncbi:MAG: TetR/AcrR family transcriptional regulator [Myxococcales bacterium]|nr:TetR/AcrR family transcriptional regulator [Myxococcales bacterium]
MSPKPTKDLILDAADELLAEVGYEGMSVQAVADRAGANKASVFYYFNSKSALIEQVLERYYAAHLAALERAYTTEGTLHERFARLVDAYLDYIEQNRRYPRLVQQQLVGGGEHLTLVQKHLAPLYRWVMQALSELAPDSGPMAARQLFVTFSSLVINYYTFAPLLASEWGLDPLGPEALAERRAHVHWIVETLLDRVERDTQRLV